MCHIQYNLVTEKLEIILEDDTAEMYRPTPEQLDSLGRQLIQLSKETLSKKFQK